MTSILITCRTTRSQASGLRSFTQQAAQTLGLEGSVTSRGRLFGPRCIQARFAGEMEQLNQLQITLSRYCRTAGIPVI